MTQWMYVSVAEENRIACFEFADGILTECGGTAAAEGPTPLALHPGSRWLYSGARKALCLEWFGRDPNTGELKPGGRVPLEADPCYIATDVSGGYLLSSYYRAGMVTVHRIGEDGSLSSEPVETVKTAQRAHCIQTDRSNRFALVPHTGPNRVYQFLFDPASGRLDPNDPPYWIADDGEEPRHFCFHPTLDVVYISNEKGSSVTACRFDSAAGTISSFQTLSTLPEGWTGANTCAQIHITPAGQPGGPFLYVSNRGHHSIACYSVDNTEGRMTALGQQPTESTPRAFNVDPTGGYLVVAGKDKGNLAVYRIGPDSGLLEPLGVVPVGSNPMWVLFA